MARSVTRELMAGVTGDQNRIHENRADARSQAGFEISVVAGRPLVTGREVVYCRYWRCSRAEAGHLPV